MRLPFGFTFERRQESATNAAIEALLGSATVSRADAGATAAAESIIGMVSRSFMVADLEPADLRGVVTPSVLASAARALLTTGNAAFILEVDADGAMYMAGPAREINVGGRSLDRRRWGYRLTFAVPTGEPVIRRRPARGVLHVMTDPSPSAPWSGRSPLTLAGLSASTLANIERSLSHDASIPTGGLMPQPDGVAASAINQVKAAMQTGKGGLTLIETTKGGFGQGDTAAPRQDWEQKRFGAMVPDGSTKLRDSTSALVMAAMGVSDRLYGGVGQDMREAYRLAHLGVVTALGEAVSAELSTFFGVTASLSFERAQYRDHRTLSRALASYVLAGMTVDAALALLGLD